MDRKTSVDLIFVMIQFYVVSNIHITQSTQVPSNIIQSLFTFSPPVPSPDVSPERTLQSQESQEEFDSLFDSVSVEQDPPTREEGPPPLSNNDLAVFDPCYMQGESEFVQYLKQYCCSNSFKTIQYLYNVQLLCPLGGTFFW